LSIDASSGDRVMHALAGGSFTLAKGTVLNSLLKGALSFFRAACDSCSVADSFFELGPADLGAVIP